MNQEPKSKLRNFICGAAVACASVSANAVTALGPISSSIPTSFQGFVGAGGSINDLFSFSLPANSGSGYSVLNFPVTIPSVGTLNTILGTATLLSNPNGSAAPDGDEAALISVTSAMPGQSVNHLSFSFGSTPPGDMFLNVTGVTSGTLGGIYNGSISVSPIPEPEMWAMLLVGTGLVGFQLRRKSKAAEANRLKLA